MVDEKKAGSSANDHEDRERREQRERIIVALHAFFEDQNANTPLQHELARLMALRKQKIETPQFTDVSHQVLEQRERIFREAVIALGAGSIFNMKGRIYSMGRLGYPSDDDILKGDISFHLEKNQKITIHSWQFDPRLGIVNYGDLIDFAKVYGVTDEEIRQLQRIEWSAEDKNKLERLERASSVYREGLPSAEPQEAAEGPLPDEEYQLLLSVRLGRYIRGAYAKLDLPPQHREQVVAEIRTIGKVEL
ncbi:hypothetical protein HY504_00545 [Candidatus Wolfebacteria bacterium]|nr:hypothetical protein [Candidatus Wolfebacteria bacterium]